MILVDGSVVCRECCSFGRQFGCMVVTLWLWEAVWCFARNDAVLCDSLVFWSEHCGLYGSFVYVPEVLRYGKDLRMYG